MALTGCNQDTGREGHGRSWENLAICWMSSHATFSMDAHTRSRPTFGAYWRMLPISREARRRSARSASSSLAAGCSRPCPPPRRARPRRSCPPEHTAAAEIRPRRSRPLEHTRRPRSARRSARGGRDPPAVRPGRTAPAAAGRAVERRDLPAHGKDLPAHVCGPRRAAPGHP